MKKNMSQLTKGKEKRLMYVENKKGPIDGYKARIGWVTFSKTAKTIYYRSRTLSRIKGGGARGNYACEETGQEYWVSGVKRNGTNLHFAGASSFHIDADAIDEYDAIRNA